MKQAVIYWSGTGNTEAMAAEIAKGMGTDEIYCVSAFTGNPAEYDKLALGCSAMGDEVLEEGEFEPFFTSLESKLGGKKIALFGSYGWGDGQWMRDWQNRAEKSGANIFQEGLILCGFPDSDGKKACHDFGQGFAGY